MNDYDIETLTGVLIFHTAAVAAIARQLPTDHDSAEFMATELRQAALQSKCVTEKKLWAVVQSYLHHDADASGERSENCSVVELFHGPGDQS